jgi:hypothetical protein
VRPSRAGRRRLAFPRAPSIRHGRRSSTRALQRYVDTDRVAGIVALAMQDGHVVYEKAFGWSDKEAGRRMTTTRSSASRRKRKH